MPRKGIYDLVFRPGEATEVGIMLDREYKDGKLKPAGYKGGFSPSQSDAIDTLQTIPLTQSDFSGGALYSKAVIPNGYAYTAPGFARSPRGVTPPGLVTQVNLPISFPPYGRITDSFEIGGDLYFLGGRVALICEGGTDTTLSTAQDLGLGFVADGASLFNSAAYIGGSGGNIWKCTSAGAFSQSADVSHRKAATVTWLVPSEGAMLPRLVMADSTLKGIRYTGGDPMVLANWTPNPSFIPVGESSYSITGIVAAPNHFYVAKEDGLHDLNTRGETPNQTPYWRQGAISSRNGACGIYQAGYVHLGHTLGADRVDVTRPQRHYVGDWTLTPHGVVNETPVAGPVTAWAIDQGWIMAAVYNETLNMSYVGAGRNRGEPGVPEGPGSMIWHFAEQIVPGEVTHMRISLANGHPRLWVASQHEADITLTWQHLPAATNPLGEFANGSDFRFGTSMVLYSTPFDWTQPDTLKILRIVGLRADNLGASVGITVETNAEDGAFVSLGTARTSPRARMAPRDPLTEGYEIGVRLTGEGTETSPPVLRAIKLDAELQNEQFDRRIYDIRVGKQQPTHGGTDRRNASRVWEDVTNLHTDGVMNMFDQEGSLLTVKVHPVQSYVAIEDTAVSGTFTRTGKLPITVLDVQLAGGIGQGAIWGDGSFWGEPTYGGAL